MNKNVLITLLRLLPDKPYLSLKFYNNFGKWPNWKSPQTFSEKLQWLKLYDRNPSYTKLLDKYAVKDYVSGIIGGEYVIPTLGVWDKRGGKLYVRKLSAEVVIIYNPERVGIRNYRNEVHRIAA